MLLRSLVLVWFESLQFVQEPRRINTRPLCPPTITSQLYREHKISWRQLGGRVARLFKPGLQDQFVPSLLLHKVRTLDCNFHGEHKHDKFPKICACQSQSLTVNGTRHSFKEEDADSWLSKLLSRFLCIVLMQIELSCLLLIWIFDANNVKEPHRYDGQDNLETFCPHPRDKPEKTMQHHPRSQNYAGFHKHTHQHTNAHTHMHTGFDLNRPALHFKYLFIFFYTHLPRKVESAVSEKPGNLCLLFHFLHLSHRHALVASQHNPSES